MNELLAWYGYGSAHENSKLLSSRHSQPGSNSSEPESPKIIEECEWCGKHINENKGLMASGTTFCSELCFSQSRRANFKKNRTCDWCKHLRHTVSYVDFQDGASQLQFCSDKCLNQYKMHIFCRETRAHLELHPHIPDGSELGGSLITPDLWMKNCKSPDHNGSPSSSPRSSEVADQTSPLPLLSTNHLIRPEAFSSSKRTKAKIQKKHRRSSSNINQSHIRSPQPSDAPQDLRVRHTPTLSKYEPVYFKEEYRINDYNRDIPNRFMNMHNGVQEKPPKYLHSHSPNEMQSPFMPKPTPLENLMPPVTVLVPYPIIIPLPLPIPIPIPIKASDLDALNNLKVPYLTVNKDNSSKTTNEDKEQETVTQTNEDIVVENEKLSDEPTKILEKRTNRKKTLTAQKNELGSVKKKKFRST
ncbi:hypothetical protein FQA39_LY00698 [Lamprigera yunnana]|nr:hypothetical protein FQA39_LY00698 [Lamprigera yunnana]